MRWILAMQSKIKVSGDGSGEDAIPLLGEPEKAPATMGRREGFFEPGDNVGTVWAIAAFEHADDGLLVGLAEKARRLFTPDTPQNPDVFGLVARLVGEERGMRLLDGCRASMNHGDGASCAPRDFLISCPVDKGDALLLLEDLSAALPMALEMLGNAYGAKPLGNWGVWVEGADPLGRSPGAGLPPARIGGFEPALEAAAYCSSAHGGDLGQASAMIEKMVALRLREELDEGAPPAPKGLRPGI